jgi:hypothetical protein
MGDEKLHVRWWITSIGFNIFAKVEKNTPLEARFEFDFRWLWNVCKN